MARAQTNLPEYTPKIMMAQKVVDAEGKTTNRVCVKNNGNVRFRSGKEAIKWFYPPSKSIR